MMAERKIAMTARKTFSECHSGHSRTSQFCVVSLNQSVSANRPQQIIGQGDVQARKHQIYPFAAEGTMPTCTFHAVLGNLSEVSALSV